MSTQPSAGRVRSTDAFIKAHRERYSVQSMCRVLGVAPSGDYEWIQKPISNRGQEDARLLRLIRASFIASQGIYGGWSAGPTKHRELVLDAVLMALRRRRPRGTIIHSDQGTQFGSNA